MTETVSLNNLLEKRNLLRVNSARLPDGKKLENCCLPHSQTSPVCSPNRQTDPKILQDKSGSKFLSNPHRVVARQVRNQQSPTHPDDRRRSHVFYSLHLFCLALSFLIVSRSVFLPRTVSRLFLCHRAANHEQTHMTHP